jgi:heat-inducible transcriptional repressor
VDTLEPRPGGFSLDLIAMRTELEGALRTTTETLSQATRLLALVSAPSPGAATIRHVEVLLLQPRVVMIVVITSTGGVTKLVSEVETPVDAGLAGWAREYLNEELAGLRLGTTAMRRKLEDPALPQRERDFLALLRPAFAAALADAGQQLYVGGAAGLLVDARADELEACQRLLELLERRAAVLELVSEALDPRRTVVRVGPELDGEAMHDVSYVGATYGLSKWTTRRRSAQCVPLRPSCPVWSRRSTRRRDREDCAGGAARHYGAIAELARLRSC